MPVSLVGLCCLVLWKQYPEMGCSSSIWPVVEAHSLSQAVYEAENWNEMSKGPCHGGLRTGTSRPPERSPLPSGAGSVAWDRVLEQPHSPA